MIWIGPGFCDIETEVVHVKLFVVGVSIKFVKGLVVELGRVKRPDMVVSVVVDVTAVLSGVPSTTVVSQIRVVGVGTISTEVRNSRDCPDTMDAAWPSCSAEYAVNVNIVRWSLVGLGRPKCESGGVSLIVKAYQVVSSLPLTTVGVG